MIEKKTVENLIGEKLSEGQFFVVSLDISASNKIRLVIDSMKGITIDEVVAFSRAIEHNLDREVEDFELEVTSPGLDQPLKVKNQYLKNIGRELDILTSDNLKIIGLLKEVSENEIVIEEVKKVKNQESGKKELMKILQRINFQDINKAFIVIKF